MVNLALVDRQNPVLATEPVCPRPVSGAVSKKMLSPTGDRRFESSSLQRRVACEPACEIAAKLGIKKTALIRVRAGVGRACSSRSDFREDFAHCSQF
ncbi:MAG TPA: hypothetical protein VHS58_18855, partial [Acetobacteraceae bacterium]|nr:hypothetical protein [Acetobacteraceae bacterium]